MTQNNDSPTLEVVQYATGQVWRTITYSSRKIEVADAKQKWSSVLDVSDSESKLWCYKEQYWIGTWNARSMDLNNLDVVMKEIARLNIYILRISELKWTGIGGFNSPINMTLINMGKNLIQ